MLELESKKHDILRILSIYDVDFETVAYEIFHLIFIASPAEDCKELFQFFCTQFDRLDEPIENHGYVICAPVSFDLDVMLDEEEETEYIQMLLAVMRKFPKEQFADAVALVYEYIKARPTQLRFNHFLIFLQSGFFPYGKEYIPILEIDEEPKETSEYIAKLSELFDHLLWMRLNNPMAMLNVALSIIDAHPGEENRLARREILDILTQHFIHIGADEAIREEKNRQTVGGKVKQGVGYFTDVAAPPRLKN